MDGLILVDKPRGLTSHDAVSEVRRILGSRKIGHFGTLDPLATGVLILAAGRATRLFPYFSKENKVYEGRFRLGFSTDTYDSEGRPDSPQRLDFPNEELLAAAMSKFEGDILQFAPSFSAKKFLGKPLYKLARARQEVPPRPSRVFISFFRAKKYAPPFLDFEVKCSSGTYVRSLANDLGRVLGCGAHLTDLRRLVSGHFDISQCLRLEEVRQKAEAGKTDEFLIPLAVLLPEFPKIVLDEVGTEQARHGQPVPPGRIQNSFPLGSFPHEANVLRLFSQRGEFLALARPDPGQGTLRPFVVLS